MGAVPGQVPDNQDWFLVSLDGSSATRILPGLKLGETAMGDIALNDAIAEHQMIRFTMNGADDCWLELLSPLYRMTTGNGASVRRERLSAGLAVELPNNRLVISPEFGVYRANGGSVEIRDAPALKPLESLPGPTRPAQPGRRRQPGWLVLSAIATLCAAVILGSPQLRETAIGYSTPIAQGAWSFMTEQATRLLPSGLWEPISPPAATTDTTVPFSAAAPPADVGGDPEPIPAPVDIGMLHVVQSTPDSAESPRVDAPTTAAETSGVEVEAVVEPPDGRLVLARGLISKGAIITPPGGNAVAVLGSLLADQPAHAEGLTLLQECADRLIAQAIGDQAAGDSFRARNTLEEVLAFSPDNDRARRLRREWIRTP